MIIVLIITISIDTVNIIFVVIVIIIIVIIIIIREYIYNNQAELASGIVHIRHIRHIHRNVHRNMYMFHNMIIPVVVFSSSWEHTQTRLGNKITPCIQLSNLFISVYSKRKRNTLY